MNREHRTMIWTWLMAAAMQRQGAARAAVEADAAMAEFDKRFGPCATCQGRGWVSNCGGEEQGRRLECSTCKGSGDRS